MVLNRSKKLESFSSPKKHKALRASKALSALFVKGEWLNAKFMLTIVAVVLIDDVLIDGFTDGTACATTGYGAAY